MIYIYRAQQRKPLAAVKTLEEAFQFVREQLDLWKATRGPNDRPPGFRFHHVRI